MGGKTACKQSFPVKMFPLWGMGEKCNLSLFVDIQCPKGNIKVL
jgi:hypothetical protein